jgi:hypothetical protein
MASALGGGGGAVDRHRILDPADARVGAAALGEFGAQVADMAVDRPVGHGKAGAVQPVDLQRRGGVIARVKAWAKRHWPRLSLRTYLFASFFQFGAQVADMAVDRPVGHGKAGAVQPVDNRLAAEDRDRISAGDLQRRGGVIARVKAWAKRHWPRLSLRTYLFAR